MILDGESNFLTKWTHVSSCEKQKSPKMTQPIVQPNASEDTNQQIPQCTGTTVGRGTTELEQWLAVRSISGYHLSLVVHPFQLMRDQHTYCK